MVVVASVLLFAAANVLVSQISVFGQAGELLRSADLNAITDLAGGRQVIAVEVQDGQVMPESWFAVAYLKPHSDVNGVRRGRLLELQTVVKNSVAERWRVTKRQGDYVQVALAGRSFSARVTSANLDRPFTVTGSFSDDEVARLIAYVRSSPRKPPIPDTPDGTSRIEVPDQISGWLPVVDIDRVDRYTVRVRLSESFYSGQHATLRYREGSWQIVEISFYIV